MKEIKITEYFEFGGSVEYLRQVTEVEPFFGDMYVQEYINRVAEYIKQLNMLVTSRSRAFDDMMDFSKELGKKEESYILTKEDCSRLRKIIDRLMEFIQAETSGKYTYTLTEKRIDVNKLFSNVELLMAPNVFDNLPDIAQYDFKGAGKCIAFELPTSAAFHLMRGTEEMVRKLYQTLIPGGSETLWGNIVQDLRNLSNPPPKPLLDNLDNIRLSFRNPTQHPEKIYDIHEVQDLFFLCIELINRMVRFIDTLP